METLILIKGGDLQILPKVETLILTKGGDLNTDYVCALIMLLYAIHHDHVTHLMMALCILSCHLNHMKQDEVTPQ